MKNKTKYLVAILFMLVAFLLIGATNVEAKTVTVTTEAELRSALKENYAEESTIKLGNNITAIAGYIGVYLNDKPLTFDLAGNTLEITNGNFVIYFGSDSLVSYDTGSFTFTDSSSGSVGQLIVYKNIIVSSGNNNSAETPKTYKFTIDGGNYSHKVATTNYLIELFNDSYGRNITADIKIKKGTFTSYSNLLWVPEANDDITMNFTFDTLTYYTSAANKLGANRFYSIKFDDVVPEDSKIYYLEREDTVTLKETELTDRNINIAELPLAATNNTYIKIIKDEGFNVDNVTLDDLAFGYSSVGTKNISIYNRGTSELQVKTVASSSTDFIVEGTDTPTISAGATDNTSFTIKARNGLSAGDYSATITVIDKDDNTYTSTVTLKVNPKEITGHGITMENWTYGESAKNPVVNGLTELGVSDYEITYAKKGSTEFSSTKPTKAGDYIVKLHVTNANYTATDVTDEFTINKNNTKIEIKANSNSWVYDGDDHTESGYEIYYDGNKVPTSTLSTGDSISATVNGSVKDVADTSTGNNVASYTLENSDCYSNILVINGTLTITPITTPIMVTAGSSNRGYTGEKLTNNTYTYTDGVLLAGDILSATITGEQLYVGTSDNTVSNVTVKRGDKDITSNYTFGTHVNGTLEVEPTLQTVTVNTNINVKVGGTLTIAQIKEQLNCNLTNYNINFVSGTAGTFNASTGFAAGASEGTVKMEAVAPTIDVNGDGTVEYKETRTSFFINVVNKETVTISGLNNNEVFTYDGNPKKPSGTIVISNDNVSLSDLDVKYTGTGGYESENAPGNAGTYTVTYKVKDSNENYTGSVSYNFTIKKIQLEKVTLATNSFEYTGESITPTINNKNNNIEITGVTTSKNVANYQIVAKLKDTNNYEWKDGSNSDVTLNWSITQATPGFTVPTNLTSVKGTTLSDVTLPDRFTWNDASIVLTAGTKTYKATYTPEDTDNYKTITNIDIQVVVKDLFNLTTSVDGGNGTITTSKTDIIEGSKEEIIFTPDTGYMIDKVFVNGAETTVTNNKLELTMNADKEVKVSYKKISYEITVKDTAGVTITPNGTVSVGYGETKEFNILVKAGYKLVKVLVNGEDKTSTLVSNKLNLTNITSNNEIEVIVDKVFNLTTSVNGGNGTITASKSNMVEGSNVEVTFTPDTGYMIDKVLVNGTETEVTGNTLELTMNADKEVKVSYKKIPFTITVEEVTGATVDPNGTVTVNYGDNKDYTITANSGYKLVKVLVNDIEKTLDGNTLKLTNITSNMNIKVIVEKIVYEVIEGAEQTYTITEDTEARFKIDANYRLFNNKVYVDNILVDDSNYTSESGSTIITFNQDYVDTLSVGEHTLRVAFIDGGEATTTFTVNKKSEEIIDNNEEENIDENKDNNNENDNSSKVENEDKKDNSSNPKTGDNIMLYVVIAGIAIIGLGATVVIKRKKTK